MNSSQQWLIIVGGGHMSVPSILVAKKDFRFKTLVIDGDANCPGAILSDRFINCSTYNIDQILAYSSQWFNEGEEVAGVITNGTDAAEAVYAISNKLGLRGIPYETARRVQNKYLMRHHLTTQGITVCQPRWVEFSTSPSNYYHSDVEEFFLQVEKCGGVVVKPIGQRASRGISIVKNISELKSAVDLVLTYSNQFLVEELLTGTEFSVEGLFNESGQPVWFNVVQRLFNYSDGHALEVGHISPAPIGSTSWAALGSFWHSVAQTMGVKFGPFKVDTLVTDDGTPYVLETACRQSGGWDSQLSTPLATGCRPIHALIALSTGKPYNEFCTPSGESKFAACYSMFSEPGTVKSISEKLRIYSNENLTHTTPNFRPFGPHIRVSVSVGSIIRPIRDCGDRVGFVVVADKDDVAAVNRAEFAARNLQEEIITEE